MEGVAQTIHRLDYFHVRIFSPPTRSFSNGFMTWLDGFCEIVRFPLTNISIDRAAKETTGFILNTLIFYHFVVVDFDSVYLLAGSVINTPEMTS